MKKKQHKERHMDWSNSWLQLGVGLFVGALIGWWTAAYFAREAARDTQQQLALARQQAQVSEVQSRMMITLLLTAEAQGQMKLARDPKGEITGFRILEGRGAMQESQDVVIGVGHVGAPAAK
jgi:hypothetical protein